MGFTKSEIFGRQAGRIGSSLLVEIYGRVLPSVEADNKYRGVPFSFGEPHARTSN